METELVALTSIENPGEAEVLKAVLEGEGIPCLLDNERQAGLTGILEIRLLVRASDLERARAIVDGHQPLEEDEDDLPGDPGDADPTD